MDKIKATYYYFQSLSWFQKLMVVVVVLLTATFILRTLTPDQVPMQAGVLKHVTSDPVNLQKIEFRGNNIAVPEQMPIATVEYKDVREELLQSLFTAFSIPSTKTPDGAWEGLEYDLVEMTEPTRYRLSRIATSGQPKVQEINTTNAINEATKIIDGIYSFGPKPQVVTSQVEILNDDEGELDSDTTEQFIRIPFAFTVKDLPIYVEQDSTYVADIILDSSYVLQSASFRPYTLNVSEGRNYRTISTGEAVGRINQNDAAVVFYRYDGPNLPDFSSIDSGVLTEAYIEYRLDLSTNTVYPYYKFSGNINNTAGYDIQTTLITPAINTDFSSSE